MTDSADTIPKSVVAPLRRRADAGNKSQRRVIRAVELVALTVATISICFALGEIAARVVLHVPLLAWRDFRLAHEPTTINQFVDYDAALGWRLKPFLKTPGFNTLAYGFRSNGDAGAQVKSGGVLAVGTSFTAGSGVKDDETWPAQMQRLTGWNVNNAGEGGYQADQIILLAEQLLPLIHPQVVVVDLTPDSVIGTGYTSAGWPKPYFTIENGKLVAHNSPVPRTATGARSGSEVKRLLAHSLIIDKFMTAFFANFWLASERNQVITIATDEIGVTCRLLDRLKHETDAANARLVLSLQYGALEVVDGSRTKTAGRLYNLVRHAKNRLERRLFANEPAGAPDWSEAAARVGRCAGILSIETVDELPELSAAYAGSPDDLRPHYQVEPGGALGHKSALGNRAVAGRLAHAIKSLRVLPDDSESR